MIRLDRVEPLLPDETARENDSGLLEVFAWQGEPTAKCTCEPDGQLKLERVEVAAWVSITLPRQGDDRESDYLPDDQLEEFFARVKASLYAWMQSLDHLQPKHQGT